MRTTRSKSFLALDHLRGGLPANGCLNHGLHIVNVDAVAGDFRAVGLDQQTGLAKFAHNGQFGKAGCFFQGALDFDCFALEYIQIGAKDFDGEGSS